MKRAKDAPDPEPTDLFDYDFAPTPITEEKGIREPEGKEATVMVDSALFAIQELMSEDQKLFAVRPRCWRKTWRSI